MLQCVCSLITEWMTLEYMKLTADELQVLAPNRGNYSDTLFNELVT
jgi:hypothetical protein